MYHTNKKNQALIEKNLKSTGFSSKHSQTDHYTPTEHKIIKLMNRYDNASWIKLSNEYIAYKVGCSIRTVIRSTNKFHKNGFITKYQENQYSSNTFTFSTRIDHKNKIITQCEYVTPNLRSSLNIINLFINPSLTRARDSRIRVFKKTIDHEKGEIVNTFKKPWPPKSKPKEIIRNKDGHSPMVRKPAMSIEEEIHQKRVSVAVFEKQLENPELYWDSHSGLFQSTIRFTKCLLAKAKFELADLENSTMNSINQNRSSSEKQDISYQHSTNTMAAYQS